MVVVEKMDQFQEIVENISKSNAESIIHKNLRLDSLKHFQALQMPDRVSHLWRYSDPLWFEVGNRNISLSTVKCFRDFDSSFCSPLDLNDLVQRNLYGTLTDRRNRLVNLNDALCKGLFIKIPSGLKNNTIRFKFLSDSHNGYECARVLILIERFSDVNIIAEFASNDEADEQSTNTVVEIFLEEGAKLNYLNLHSHGINSTYHLHQRVKLSRSSIFNNSIVALGGKLSKCDLGVNLARDNSNTSIYGIVLGEGVQRFDHHTRIEHNAPNTKSELDFRVALKDIARSAYTGNLKIAHEAVKSDAHQENRNLLLSSDAKAESIPELEILTNDVIRCNHGVTVSQVDKDQIYYLTSRGLDPKEAERIIIEGFFEPTISRIPDENLKEEISNKINKKLENVK